MDIDWFEGDRTSLTELFTLAEDSRQQLDAYLPLGRVLVARDGDAVVGHLQLVPTGRDGEIELKNMAVLPERQGSGVGRALVDAAVARSRDSGLRRMIVATAAADIGNLRFYQRVGFRFDAVERDAFTPANGYPDPIAVDGIPLLDRVWLARDLGDAPAAASS
jgi:ribosomal protein S18 acetylase RimI-like enzyme